MKIEKLPSGSYRVRKTVDKKTYSFTFPNKPTKREIDAAIRDRLQNDHSDVKGTFEYYGKEYIELKRNVLSPSTLRGYLSYMRNLSPRFLNLRMSLITAADVQAEINRIAINSSPKTARNYHAFISPVLAMYRPDLTLRTTLPQSVRNETYVPTDGEVKQLLTAARGRSYELALWLGVYGMRLSEVLAVTDEDLSGNMLSINKAYVNGPDGYVLKNYTKTEESTRTIYIDDYVAGLLHDQKKGFSGHPRKVLEYMNDLQDKIGVPRCKYHALRHYYASMAHTIGIPDAYIQKAGGWSSPYVLQRVYRHAQKDHENDMMKQASGFLTNLATEIDTDFEKP